MTPHTGDWRRALRAALVEQLLGPPGRWRWPRILIGLAFLFAVALALPRADLWPPGVLPMDLLLLVPLMAVAPMYRERLLRRPKNRQIVVFVAAVITQGAALTALVLLSVTIGAERGESLMERVTAWLRQFDIPLWLVVSLLVLLALLGYRSNKREEAALRAQGEAEQAGMSTPSN